MNIWKESIDSAIETFGKKPELPTIGTPVLHSDMANHRTGWIASVRESSGSKIYGYGNGLQAVTFKADIVWSDGTTSRDLFGQLVIDYIAKASGPIINYAILEAERQAA